MLLIQSLKEEEKYQIWRKRNHIRLADVAKFCGCSIGALSLFENGELNLSDELLGYYDEYIERYEKGLLKR